MNPIGVVIPCKNYAHFIGETLRSVTQQGVPVNVVVVNDGGADGEILDKIAAVFSDVRVIHLPESRGIGIARNLGAAYLNTDSFLFLDADDWLHEGAIEALSWTLLTQRRGAFAYGNYTENGQVIQTPAWNPELLRSQNVASYCNLWRRGEFWQIGGYSGIRVAEDWELQRRAKRAGMMGAKVDALIFEHRLHDHNKWTADSAQYGGMAGVAQLVAGYGEQ